MLLSVKSVGSIHCGYFLPVNSFILSIIADSLKERLLKFLIAGTSNPLRFR